MVFYATTYNNFLLAWYLIKMIETKKWWGLIILDGFRFGGVHDQQCQLSPQRVMWFPSESIWASHPRLTYHICTTTCTSAARNLLDYLHLPVQLNKLFHIGQGSKYQDICIGEYFMQINIYKAHFKWMDISKGLKSSLSGVLHVYSNTHPNTEQCWIQGIWAYINSILQYLNELLICIMIYFIESSLK